MSVDSFERRPQEERDKTPAGPVETPVPEQSTAAARLASTIGNQAFTRVAREGAGILPGGRVHPDVEETIGRTRGSGQSLDPSAVDRYEPALGESVADVRVHTDDTADALTSSVAARAFTTGSDVYFARGEYRPGSSDGDQLLAHELAHVAQQQGAPAAGPMVVSQPGDALEVEADEAAGELHA